MRLGVLTSGGDSPGMNAAVRAVTRKAQTGGHQVLGVMEGFRGLTAGDLAELSVHSVSGIIDRGGTILRSSRFPEFKNHERQQEAAEICRERLDGLVVIGGNGSQAGSLALHEAGVKVVGVPSTIDNDLAGTDYCIGFDTALNTVIENLAKIRDTASALERVFVIEVMGRSSGAIALTAGLAGGADCVVIPEVDISLEQVCEAVASGYRRGKTHILIVVAEGASSAYEMAEGISRAGGYDVKISVLGHIQRGGSPSALDRTIASRLGVAAVDALVAGGSGVMVGVCGTDVVEVQLREALGARRSFDEDMYRMVADLAS